MNVTKRVATAIFTATVAFTVVGCSSTPTRESAGESGRSPRVARPSWPCC